MSLVHIQVPSSMTLVTSRPSGLPLRCCWGHLTCWTTSCACVMSYLCSPASVSSRVVSSQARFFLFVSVIKLPRCFILLWSVGIPFVYRGLPCIYSSAILASASLLSGGNMTMLRVLAMAMILFMISQNFYPHDRVLESQAWKKVVYAGGKAIQNKFSRIHLSLCHEHNCQNWWLKHRNTFSHITFLLHSVIWV